MTFSSLHLQILTNASDRIEASKSQGQELSQQAPIPHHPNQHSLMLPRGVEPLERCKCNYKICFIRLYYMARGGMVQQWPSIHWEPRTRKSLQFKKLEVSEQGSQGCNSSWSRSVVVWVFIEKSEDAAVLYTGTVLKCSSTLAAFFCVPRTTELVSSPDFFPLWMTENIWLSYTRIYVRNKTR